MNPIDTVYTTSGSTLGEITNWPEIGSVWLLVFLPLNALHKARPEAISAFSSKEVARAVGVIQYKNSSDKPFKFAGLVSKSFDIFGAASD